MTGDHEETGDSRPSAARLAEALAQVPGMPPAMIERAAGGYYGDFSSPLAFPEMQLVTDLRDMAKLPTTGPRATEALAKLAARVIAGEFDATKAEADAWAASQDGREAFRLLLKGNDEGKGGQG